MREIEGHELQIEEWRWRKVQNEEEMGVEAGTRFESAIDPVR